LKRKEERKEKQRLTSPWCTGGAVVVAAVVVVVAGEGRKNHRGSGVGGALESVAGRGFRAGVAAGGGRSLRVRPSRRKKRQRGS